MNSSRRVSGRGQREIENEIEIYIFTTRVTSSSTLDAGVPEPKGMKDNQSNATLLLQTWKGRGRNNAVSQLFWVHVWNIFLRGCIKSCIFFVYHGATALMILGLLTIDTSRSHSAGLLCTSDQPSAETSTWKHTILSRSRHPYPRWDSNPRSKRASGRRS